MSVPLRSLPLHAMVRHLPLMLPRRVATRSVAAENRQVPQGPCGVAFLGDTSLGAYTLLLYKSQENHLARVPFTDQFKLESTVSGKSSGTDATDRMLVALFTRMSRLLRAHSTFAVCRR